MDVEHRNAVAEKLLKVFVLGDDADVHILGRRVIKHTLSNGGNDVVRFQSLNANYRDIEVLKHLSDARNLRY